jgi:hypothetical protein
MGTMKFGQSNQQGDDQALFMEKLVEGVLESYYAQAVMLDKVYTEIEVKGSKSAIFEKMGKSGNPRTASIGGTLTYDPLSFTQATISIDDITYAGREIDDLDTLKDSNSKQDKLKAELGRQMAEYRDRNEVNELIKAALSDGDVDNQGASTPVYDNPGHEVTDSDVASATPATKGDALIAALEDAKVALEEADCPMEDCYALLRPADYMALFRGTNKDLINKNFGAMGNIAKGVIEQYVDLQLVKTNHLYREDMTNSSSAHYSVNHGVDASAVYAVVFHKSAIGTVTGWLPRYEMLRDKDTFCDYLRVSQALGHGILRPESAVIITSSTQKS